MSARTLFVPNLDFVLFILIVLPGCDTEVVRLEGMSTTPTTADLVAFMNHTNSWKTFRVTAVSSDPTGGSITWNFLPGEEHFMFYIFGGMLTPATKQTITVHLADGVDASSGAVVDNDSKTVTKTFCTLPRAAIVQPGQGVMEDDTTKSQIKISWTNPSLLGGVNVTLGNFTQTIINPNVSEFTFTESAPGTALVPGYNGVCEVKVLGIADCQKTGSALLLIRGCNTKLPSETTLGADQSPIEDKTTTNAIKMKWTNASSVSGINVTWGETFETTLDANVTEHVSKESAPGTSLTASPNGTYTSLVVSETITSNSISLTCSLENGNDLSIASASLTDSGGSPVTGANDSTSGSASHTLTWQNLSPNSKYDLVLLSVVDQTSSKTIYSSKNFSYCTLPSEATIEADQGLIEDETTTTEIKIKWTNPSSLGGIKVTWGETFETTLDATATEYIFKESAPGTPLTAGQNGTCKVIVLGSAGCTTATQSALEIRNCNTKVYDAEMVLLEETSTTTTTSELVAVMNHTQSRKTFRVIAVSSDPTGESITWTFLPSEEHFMFHISGDGLPPATKQTVTVQLADGVNGSTGAVVENESKTVTKSICTLPEAAIVQSGQGVMEDDTTKTQIKISWTNPSLLGGVNVTLGNFTQTIINPNVSEFIFTESAPGTALVPGYSGRCEVKVLGTADCHTTGSAVLLISGCDTKHTSLVVSETITSNSISLTCRLENGNDLSIASASLTDSGGSPVTGANDATSGAAFHTLTWRNLSQKSKYNLLLLNVVDQTSSKTLYSSKNFSYLTLYVVGMVLLEETSTTTTTLELVAVMNHTHSWKTFRVTAVSSDPTGGSITWTVLPSGEHSIFYIFGDGLTPATKQTVTVQLADGVDASTGAVVDNDSKTVTTSVCTVPEAATVEPGQGVMEDDTTKTQIKISWTNPSLLGGVNVTLGNFTQTIIDPNVSEFTFTESAPGTALVPGYSGVCEVKVLGIADCHMTGSAVLLISGCDTKPTTLVVNERITSNSISLTCRLENGNDLFIASASLTGSGGSPVTGFNDATSRAASHTLTWRNLSPNSKYDLVLNTVVDQTTFKVLHNSKNFSYFTLPSEATIDADQVLIEDGATTNEIKVEWTNPPSVSGINVTREETFGTTLDANMTEYNFEESAPGTPPTAGQNGTSAACACTVQINIFLVIILLIIQSNADIALIE